MWQRFRSFPVILMTGSGSEEVSVAAFRGGVRDYPKEPVRLDNLVARVEAMLVSHWEAGESKSPVWHQAPSAKSADGRGAPNGGIQRAMAFIDAHLDG